MLLKNRKSPTMKIILILSLLILSFFSVKTPPKDLVAADTNPFDQPVASCGTFSPFSLYDSLVPVTLQKGLGNLNHPVTTQVPLAQKFFNQGLSYLYAFNHAEAIRSFNKAAQLDPDCAMAYWGMAHAYGPNINMPMTEEAEKLAFDAIQKANALISKVSRHDAAYIGALALRYDNKPDDQAASDSVYLRAMKQVMLDYPEDPDAQTLYADAVMNTFAWQYWEAGGKFKPKAKEVLTILEDVIHKNPNHTGAHHLLVHLVEGSDQPSLGLKSANTLAGLMPRAGHIVHMPSHIYIRTGSFDRAAQSNIQAIGVDEEIYGQALPEGAYAMYYGHNIHFLYFTANMLGKKKLSLTTARKLSSKIPKDQLEKNLYAQEFTNVTYYSLIRFGEWEEMLKMPDPGSKFPYMQSMWHFGRGLAYIRKGEISQAKEESRLLDSLSKLEVLQTLYASLDPVSKTVTIADKVLQGELKLNNGRVEEGLTDLRQAVLLEDQMIYNEPPTWPIPVRQFLGAALLNNKKFPQAEQTFRDDLERHPENGWSLFGLERSLEAQARNPEALAVAGRFKKAWKESDITLRSSIF